MHKNIIKVILFYFIMFFPSLSYSEDGVWSSAYSNPTKIVKKENLFKPKVVTLDLNKEDERMTAFIGKFDKIKKVINISPSLIAVRLDDGSSYFITKDGGFILGNVIVSIDKKGYLKASDVLSGLDTAPQSIKKEAKKETNININIFKLKGWRVNGNIPDMVLFFDPKCPYCHKLINKLELSSNKIPYLAVPVAVIRNSLPEYTAELLNGSWDNSVKVMNRKTQLNHNSFLRRKDALDKLKYNTSSYYSLNQGSVPVIMLRDGFIIKNPLQYSVQGLKNIIEKHNK